jgi:predicted alpha/beta-fold hydrolase
VNNPPARGAWWARGPHAQTIWGKLGRSSDLVSFEREVLSTPDDDDLMLDHLTGPGDSPRVLMLHGLEGCSLSVYIQGLAAACVRAGMRVTVLNFRSCARDLGNGGLLPNRRPRLYHSGETTDLDFVVRTLAKREPKTPLLAVGVSLGGNVLLKWLGEQGARSPIEAAAAISVPYDLAAASKHLERGFAQFYAGHFLKTLKRKVRDVIQRFPRETEHLDPDRIRLAETLGAFDDYATAPLHGFRSAADYYLRSSSLRVLSQIEVPTLCLNSQDDPFMPAEVLERAREAASDDVTITVSPWGGHGSFAYGGAPWKARYWAEEEAVTWLASRPA